MNITKDYILQNAINIYCFGSYVYETNTKTSDKDFIVIMPNGEYPEQFHIDNEDYNIFTEKEWLDMVEKQSIEVLESSFLQSEFIIKKTKDYPLKLNYDLIRKTISSTSSNSFVKCKKKLTIEKDYNPYIGKKSLWHTLRLLLFGIELMNFDKIYDYHIANEYYDDIVNNENNDWEYYKNKYQPIYNKLHSEFKKAHLSKNSQ
jgi:predicted nucleotidyltransferase